jgi:capsular exopolysaccharide synthesis family protein
MNIHKPSTDPAQEQSLPPRRPLEDLGDIDLRGILRVLWRRKAIIAGTMFVLTAASAVIVQQMTPRYDATTRVLLDSRDQKIVNVESVVPGKLGDEQAITSEIEIIHSERLAEKVIRELGLYDDPEFNSELRPESFIEALAAGVDKVTRFIGEENDQQPVPAEVKFDEERVKIIQSFLDKLSAERRGPSRVVSITFESENPETAALVANKTAELYLVEQLDARYQATRRAASWLSERLEQLRKQVEKSESAVEAYKREAGLIQGKNVSLTAQQASELNAQLIMAQGARAEAEARLRQVTSLLDSARSADSAAEVLASPLIQNLRQQEATIERRIAELSNEYGDKHPRMISARAEMNDLRAKISAEVDKIVQNLRNEVSVARAREASLRSSLKGLEQQMADQNDSGIDLRALQREADANRQLYETFLSRFKETSMEEDLPNIASRIISNAELPTKPSYPKKKLTILLVLGGSLILGILLAFAQEHLTPGFVSLEQIETTLGLPALGLLPTIPKSKGKPEEYVIKNPLSELNEAVRTIYTALSLSYIGKYAKVLLVTSAFPKEGKTTLSIMLSRVFAALGKKVLIIDADLRRAEVHGRLGLHASPGLVELLEGEAKISEVLQRDAATGLEIIPVGRVTSNAAELLNSDRLQKVLDRISGEYDLVVIDSPPTMAVADARILSHLADATIFVARWSATRREVVTMATKQILEAGGTVGGIVLSRVNARKHSTYGYGDSGSYYGELTKYYSR